MKIIIFGATELGCLIATNFFEDHDITIIDKEENFSNNINKLDISFISGNASNINVLEKAEIHDADLFLACSDFDEVNIVSCLTAKRISGIKTICFVSKEEYKSSLGLSKDGDYPCDIYIDEIIWPEELLTQDIFRIITVSEAIDVENFANDKARLLEYRIKENSILVDKRIRDCEFPKDTLIVGITRDGIVSIPTGNTVLESNDKVIFMGSSKSLDKLAGRFFHEKGVTKTITIIGGGNVGKMLAENLEDARLKVKIIEKNYARCEKISEDLSNTLIINGDGTDLSLLNEEEIFDSDVVVSVTNNDEKNLLCSLLAKQLGVKRVIARVTKNANMSLFEKVGIDIAVSTKNAALNEVKNNISETNVDIVATVEQGQGEILELKTPESFEDIMIKDLRLPAKAIISIIQRRNKVIIPKGDTFIKRNDNLTIFTTSENSPIIKEFFKAGQ
ncbi:TPA: Trk system potassium transporter TrkA [Candidatus Gastranaerophilales bacterium HUM_9]|nr:MAG TPA: Trk system potassium transporter TrkA [Candidatus Gastranaerophilales bacterium HUM_9]HBX34674.1 Trk system potassium transporter TrkA [Cyanobacteria bacterium UBA11440]